MQADASIPHKPQHKTCSKCQANKPHDEFNFKNRANNVRHSYCKECGKALTRRHYAHNKRQYLDRNSRAYLKRREFVRQMKSRPCADCGVQYPYYVMDFDHRKAGSKSFMLSDFTRGTRTSLGREMAKCDLVCANCHRERTHQRQMKVLRG